MTIWAVTLSERFVLPWVARVNGFLGLEPELDGRPFRPSSLSQSA